MDTQKIRGIIPAVVTPLTEQEEVDEEALEVVLNRLIGKGVHGVFTVGTTGEFWALTPEEKRRVFRRTVACTGGRVPVYLGTCANSTREAVMLSEWAAEAGADCISVLTPCFITPTDEELFRHYAAIAKAVDIPILLYGNPDRTGVKLSVGLTARLAEQFPNVVGIKDSSGDLTLTTEYIRKCPKGFRTIMGRDTLIFAGLMHGTAGAIAASANIAPEIGVAIYEHFVKGDLQKALEYQDRLAPLRLAFTLGSFPIVLKEGAEMVGLPAGPARAPIGRLSPEKRKQLRDILVEMGLEVVK
jgi:4-hydroxy-tetrahydrodipicolinate synthase